MSILRSQHPAVYILCAFSLLAALIASAPGIAPGQDPAAGSGSETDVLPATLVTTNGDSLTGHVERWRTMGHTPEAIRFRRTASDSTVTYRPSELTAIRFESLSRRFVSRVVQVDQVPTDPRAADRFLRSDRQPTKPDTLFLDVLVDGPLALYVKQGSRSHYFVETAEGDITELIKRRRYVRSEEAVATDSRYRRQLAARMSGCPDLQEETPNLSFGRHQLKELVAEYNRCVGDGAFVRSDQPLFTTSFSVIGGISRSRFSLSGTVSGFFGGTESRSDVFGWGTAYKLGVALTVLPRGSRRWAMRAELAGLTQRIQAGPERAGQITLNGALSRSDYVEMHWLKGSLLGRYSVSTRNWGPYLEAGLTAGYLVAFDSQTPIRSTVAPRVKLEEYVTDEINHLKRINPGVIAGTGVRYDAFRVGVRAELSTLWASYNNFKSEIVNFSFSIEYRL